MKNWLSWCRNHGCTIGLWIIGGLFASTLGYLLIRLFVVFPSIHIVQWDLF
jgi:hypothetical protein